VGDAVLIYHSNADPSGIAGLARVSRSAIADPTQFDPESEYFDPKANRENPRWFSPELKFVEKFEELIALEQLRAQKILKDMVLLQRGSRLSVQPVSLPHFKLILRLAN
jgi:predicted RNA-binding protein with PUA-like domain